MLVNSRGGLPLAAKLLDPRLVDPCDNSAADYRAWYPRIAEPPHHVSLHARGGGIQESVLDVITREDGPDLSAIGTPIGVVHDNALATAGVGRSRSKREQHRRNCHRT